MLLILPMIQPVVKVQCWVWQTRLVCEQQFMLQTEQIKPEGVVDDEAGLSFLQSCFSAAF